MTKKVLVITYYWPPSGGAGVQRWVKFVKYLPEFGIEPIVLTVDPNNASYPLIDKSLLNEVADKVTVFTTRSSEPFGLYKKFTSKRDIPQAGFANESAPSFTQKVSRAIRGNLFIPDARKGWNKYAYQKALEIIREFDIKTVITSSPPHSTQLIGLKLKQDLGVKWIADLRDPWTDIYYYDKLYHSVWAKNTDKKYEQEVVNSADNVLVVSDDLKRIYAEKLLSLDVNKIKVIPNGFDEGDFDRGVQSDNSKFIITYTGTLAANYHIEMFLNALSDLIKSKKSNTVLLRFVGVVAEHYKELIKQSSLNKVVDYVDHVPHKKSIRYLQESTALLLAIPDVSQNKGILTGKLFEYLAAKKPIIGIGPADGDASMIIDQCMAGKMHAYQDSEGIQQQIEQLYKKWENNESINLSGIEFNTYSRQNLSRNLARLILGK